MKRTRSIEILGSAALAVAILLGVDGLRGGFGASTVQAAPQSDSRLSSGPGFQSNLGDPPTFLNAGSQRIEQLGLMREVLLELKGIRGLLQDGGARVTVDSVELDYERISSALVPDRTASSGSGSAMIERTGEVRRVSQGESSQRVND